MACQIAIEAQRAQEKSSPLSAFSTSIPGHRRSIEARHFHKFFDADADRYLPLLDEFRASCPLVVAGKGQTRIAAVHIRRGDVAKPGSEVTRRLTSMDANARAIEIIQATWPGIEVRVFSQGPPEDFSRLPGGCKFYLDVDVFETLRQLLNADVLVTAKSSFSYVAALLSRGTVIYEPFWHSPTFFLDRTVARRIICLLKPVI